MTDDVRAEPILAYRVWNVKGSLLASASEAGHGRFWPPRQILQAVCAEAHNAPADRCSAAESTMGCGYFAMKAPELEPSDFFVIGEVWLWGKVIEHEHGYRAQYAYPAAIYNNHPQAKEIAKLYGVPVKEPPHEPDWKTIADNPSRTNNLAGTSAANLVSTNTFTVSSPLPPIAPSPSVAPRARKGARLNLWGAVPFAFLAIGYGAMRTFTDGVERWLWAGGASFYTGCALARFFKFWSTSP